MKKTKRKIVSRKMAKTSAITGHHGTDCPNSTWRYYRRPHHCVIDDGLLCLAVALFIAGAVIVVALLVVVVEASH